MGLALVFIYAGAIKLADPYSFAILIEAYGLIPEVLLMPVAVGLPALEVMAAIGLIFDVRGSLMVIAVLLAIFILVWGMACGWVWMWTAAASARKTRKGKPMPASAPPCIGILFSWVAFCCCMGGAIVFV